VAEGVGVCWDVLRLRVMEPMQMRFRRCNDGLSWKGSRRVGACEEGVLAAMVRMVSVVDLYVIGMGLLDDRHKEDEIPRLLYYYLQADVVTAHIACSVSRQ
jgi:hypothetical protein